jgi:hypothetical protein
MQTQSNISTKQNSKAAANISAETDQSNYVDTQSPKTVLQKMADDSPNVIKNKAYQQIADNSNQVKQLESYQTIANHYTAKSRPVTPVTQQKGVVQRVEAVVQMAGEGISEYKHVAIDKADIGLGYLIMGLNMHGLRTAEAIGIELSEGSKKLKHHQHVFLWDSSAKGKKGAEVLEGAGKGDRVTVRVRNKSFKEQGGGFFSPGGNLKGDNGELGGSSTNGAWAVEGNVSRKQIFIEGLDLESDEGYDNWLDGLGWPPGHEIMAQIRLLKSPVYLDPKRSSAYAELQKKADDDFKAHSKASAFTIEGKVEYEEQLGNIMTEYSGKIKAAGGSMEISAIKTDGLKRLQELSDSVG